MYLLNSNALMYLKSTDVAGNSLSWSILDGSCSLAGVVLSSSVADVALLVIAR